VDAGVVSEKLAREDPLDGEERELARVVQAGGDRQQAHERLREHAMKARAAGDPRGVFVALVETDLSFAKIKGELAPLMDPARLVGRAPDQVRRFLEREVAPRLERAKAVPAFDDPLEV
jgi:adenylosuccinate lyase